MYGKGANFDVRFVTPRNIRRTSVSVISAIEWNRGYNIIEIRALKFCGNIDIISISV